ncbi:MAG: hypothetical protein ACLUE2_00225 [Bacteroides cellulosilyticus]
MVDANIVWEEWAGKTPATPVEEMPVMTAAIKVAVPVTAVIEDDPLG